MPAPLSRTCDEVRKRLAQASGVAAHRRRIGIDLHANVGARLPRGFGEVVGDAVRKHCEIDLLEIQG